MEKRNGKETRVSKTTNDGIPVLRVRKGASLKTIYAAARKAFTAADLQKYTEIEEGIPAEQVLRDLEAHCQEEEGRRKMKRHAPSGK
jgi:hypothetical protein